MKIVDLSLTLPRDINSPVPGHPELDLEDFHFDDKDFRPNSFLQMSTHTGLMSMPYISS